MGCRIAEYMLEQGWKFDMTADVVLWGLNCGVAPKPERFLRGEPQPWSSFDVEICAKLSSASFAVLRACDVHPVLGMWVENVLDGNRRIWVADKKLNLKAGALFAARLLDAGPFHMSLSGFLLPDFFVFNRHLNPELLAAHCYRAALRQQRPGLARAGGYAAMTRFFKKDVPLGVVVPGDHDPSVGPQSYREPVSRLLERQPETEESVHYPTVFGFSDEHADELVRMVCDPVLNGTWSDVEYGMDILEEWAAAPLHALRALAQLGSERIVPSLLTHILAGQGELRDLLPEALVVMGPKVLPYLSGYLSETGHHEKDVLMIAGTVETIGHRHPSVRDDCVAALTDCLRNHASHDKDTNAWTVGSLMMLSAKESIDIVREAFDAGHLDLTVVGDEWGHIEYGFGLRATQPLLPALSWMECNHMPPHAPMKAAVKVGRNDPCLCGSGKKYKKCCL